jgi:hypothetical protein
VIAPLITYRIARRRRVREAVIDLVDEACNALTSIGRSWPRAALAIDSVSGEELITPRLHQSIYAEIDDFAGSLWDARAVQVRLRIRLREQHPFYLAYSAALHSVDAIERNVDAFRAGGGAHSDREVLAADADDAWAAFNADHLPKVFERATELYKKKS